MGLYKRLAVNVVHMLCLATVACDSIAQAQSVPEFVPGSWTLVVIPDTQFYTLEEPQIFPAITNWIVANEASRNIPMVALTGDITAGNTADVWANASSAMDILDVAGIPYTMPTGNHDYDNWVDGVTRPHATSRDNTMMADFFPASRFDAMSTVGGVYNNGPESNYQLFSAGGEDYISLALEWGPRNEVLAWADGVLSQYPNRKAIVATHAYTYSDGTRYDWAAKGNTQLYNPHDPVYGTSAPNDGTEDTNDGQEIWDKLVDQNKNVGIVVSAHIPWGSARQTAMGQGGRTVQEMVAAYHVPPEGWIRLLEFQPDGRTVQAKTYSPYLDQYMTTPDQQFLFYTEPLPNNSIMVSTRGSATGTVALDGNGLQVANFIPDDNGGSGYDNVDVAVAGSNGELALSEQGPGHRISRYDSAGNYLGTFTGTPSGNIFAASMATSDNSLFVNYNSVAELGGNGAIARLNTNTGEQEAMLDLGSGVGPRGLTVGPDGFLYMASNGSGILKIAQDFSSSEVFAPMSGVTLSDLVFGPDDNLYLVNQGNDRVDRYDGTTGSFLGNFVGSSSGGLDVPTGLIFHPTTGNLLVSSNATDQILQYDGLTGAFIDVFASVDSPWGISLFQDPVPGVWSSDASGDWASFGHWSLSTIADDNTKTAIFGSTITSSQTVFTNVAVTVKRIEFDNANTYTIAGIGSVNLDGNATNASIDVVQGSHQFQAAVNLVSNTDVSVAGGATLTFNSALNLSGKILTKTGDGTMNINNSLITAGGSVQIIAGALSGSGELFGDLTNSGGMIAPGNSPGILSITGNYLQEAGTLEIEISGSVAGQTYDILSVAGDLTISGGSLDIAMNFTPTPGDTFEILAFNTADLSGALLNLGSPGTDMVWDSSQLAVDGSITTLSSLLGDMDGDLVLTSADMDLLTLVLQDRGSYDVNGYPVDADLNGDIDFNGSLDLDDMTALNTLLTTSAVPEPASASLLAMAMAALTVGRRRKERS